MKRVYIVLIALLLFVNLGACGKKNNTPVEESPMITPAAADAPEETVSETELPAFSDFSGFDFGPDGLELPEDDLSDMEIIPAQESNGSKNAGGTTNSGTFAQETPQQPEETTESAPGGTGVAAGEPGELPEDILDW